MTNNEEMRSPQAQSQINQPPQPFESPEMPITPEKALEEFDEIKTALVGPEPAWVFRIPPTGETVIPNPRTAASKP
jgi:hypothetical protein